MLHGKIGLDKAGEKVRGDQGDARNRRAACKLVNIEPDVHQLDGEDPTAYVLSANIHRRHMTKGQRAMAVAKVCLISGQTYRDAAQGSKVSRASIGNASLVLGHVPAILSLKRQQPKSSFAPSTELAKSA